MRISETRPGITHKFVVGTIKGYITVALEDQKVTDIFVSVDKEGSTLGAWIRAWAVSISKSLQAGVPLKKITDQYRGWQFDPRGVTNTPQIPIAASIPDYCARWLDLKFGENDDS